MSPASYQTAPPRFGSVSAGRSTGQHRRRKMRAGVWMRRSSVNSRSRRVSEKLAGENPDVAFAMDSTELDDLFFERSRVRLRVGEHQLLRDGVVDSVGFDIKVVIVTDNKCHLVRSTSNEPSYKIFSVN